MTGRRVQRTLTTAPLAFGLGLAVAILGTTAHRAAPPWGLFLALAAAASGATLARGLAGLVGLAGYGAALLLFTQLALVLLPGGDVLIASDALGHGWLYGSVAACAVAAFLPRRWFADPTGSPARHRP